MDSYIPDLGCWYMHQDGGVYRVLALALSTVDQSTHIIYKHEFPFEQQVWSRPINEWTYQRFQRLGHLWNESREGRARLSENREEAQQEITARKAARRQKPTCTMCKDLKLIGDNLGNTYECICTV